MQSKGLKGSNKWKDSIWRCTARHYRNQRRQSPLLIVYSIILSAGVMKNLKEKKSKKESKRKKKEQNYHYQQQKQAKPLNSLKKKKTSKKKQNDINVFRWQLGAKVYETVRNPAISWVGWHLYRVTVNTICSYSMTKMGAECGETVGVLWHEWLIRKQA